LPRKLTIVARAESRQHETHLPAVEVTKLDDARRKAIQQQLEIAWEYRDMRDLPWKEEFGGAFCFGGSFGYTLTASFASCLRRLVLWTVRGLAH